VRTIQRIGRVLRKHPNKKQAAIIDFIDNAKFLIDHSKIRYKIYTSEEEFEVYIPPHIKWKKSKLE
jgi:superfamily II DNA or RNA helicase